MFESNESLEDAVARNVSDALKEDLGRGDWSARAVATHLTARAELTLHRDAVLCGRAWFAACIQALDPAARLDWRFADGEHLTPGSWVCTVQATARALLSAERAALNLLQTLTGTATITRAFVQAIEGASPNPNGCAILDTRRTLPGLRQAQKYAVRMGGGRNHRLGLWDAILIRRNHIAAAGGVAPALEAARRVKSGSLVQVEVGSLAELGQALAADATDILLEDFTLADMRAATALCAGRATLEVSGDVDLESVRGIAATGVDRIAVAQLTKDVRAADFSLRVVAIHT